MHNLEEREDFILKSHKKLLCFLNDELAKLKLEEQKLETDLIEANVNLEEIVNKISQSKENKKTNFYDVIKKEDSLQDEVLSEFNENKIKLSKNVNQLTSNIDFLKKRITLYESYIKDIEKSNQYVVGMKHFSKELNQVRETAISVLQINNSDHSSQIKNGILKELENAKYKLDEGIKFLNSDKNRAVMELNQVTKDFTQIEKQLSQYSNSWNPILIHTGDLNYVYQKVITKLQEEFSNIMFIVNEEKIDYILDKSFLTLIYEVMLEIGQVITKNCLKNSIVISLWKEEDKKKNEVIYISFFFQQDKKNFMDKFIKNSYTGNSVIEDKLYLIGGKLQFTEDRNDSKLTISLVIK